MKPVFEFTGPWSGQLFTTAIHTGHELRPEIAAATALDDATRFREEDPFTDQIGARAGAAGQLIINRSRFEVDHNRPREKAVYRRPADAWDLDLWRDGELDAALAEESLAEYDATYAALAERLDEIAARGPFVLYDVHSYNHRREANHEPSPQSENPEVNVGTGTLDKERFGPVVSAFMTSMTDWTGLDVRENVRFEGGHLSTWVHERYPGVGCVLALEFKKVFMDEWTGEPDQKWIERLAMALESTVDPVVAALGKAAR